jgi:hypothetical protein
LGQPPKPMIRAGASREGWWNIVMRSLIFKRLARPIRRGGKGWGWFQGAAQRHEGLFSIIPADK